MTELKPRAMTLTEADMTALTKLLQEQHMCRFSNVTREDMDFIKDLLAVYKETRSEVLKWAVKFVVYSALIAIFVGAYIKLNLGGHK